jgi:hypothetical protein
MFDGKTRIEVIRAGGAQGTRAGAVPGEIRVPSDGVPGSGIACRKLFCDFLGKFFRKYVDKSILGW